MNNHYNPEPVVIAEPHKFWTTLQEESEAVCDFIVRLQKLARTCGFGGFLQEALRDSLVSGLHPKMKKIQCYLWQFVTCHFKLSGKSVWLMSLL